MLLLYRLNLEVKSDKRKNHALEILHQVVESTQAFRVLGLIYIDQ